MKTETNATHTPGPWHLSEHGQFIRYRQSDGTTANIADIGNVFGGPPNEGAANAYVLAASPDLLEALEDASDVLDDLEAHLQDPRISLPYLNTVTAVLMGAQVAIAKARVPDMDATCPTCHGHGYIPGVACAECEANNPGSVTE